MDNLLNNICKYAQPGTRVYLDLKKDGDHAVLSFRNISREPLTATAQELTERFTRGDSSRSTEGNGLGLSIADSLTELQNGKMQVVLDGDLFKVLLEFPLLQEDQVTDRHEGGDKAD
jgi:signal transduction histidine kinase